MTSGHFRTEYVDPGARHVCASVCVCVYVCVSVTAFYLNTIWPIFMKLGLHDLPKKRLCLSEGILLMFFVVVNGYDKIYHKNHLND